VEEVALELARAVVERDVLAVGPTGLEHELSSGSVLVNIASGAREIGRRRMVPNMKVRITIIIKRVRILRCKWKKGNTHRKKMDLLPTGNKLLVGEFMKTRHPLNIEDNEICDASFQGQRTHEDLESGIREISKSRMCGELDSRTLEVSELRTRDGSES
jgi:hypothetical protein